MTAAVRTTQRAYPAYKDSGIEWLGEIPEHWCMVPIKRISTLQGGVGFPEEEQGKTDEELAFYKVSDTNLPGNEIYMLRENNTVSRERANHLSASVIPKGSIIFPKVGAVLLLNKRRITTKDCCIDNNLMSVTPRSCSEKWLYYWLLGLDLRPFSNPGAVPSINEGQIQEIAVPLPSKNEQEAIARFLDHKTAQIDALIAKKEALLARLADKRTALISQAVTQGLDPTVPMRDSGIEWLGEIPAHWVMSKLRYQANVISKGTTPSTIYREFSNEGIRFIKAENIQNGVLHASPEFFIDEETDLLLKRSQLQANDVLIVIAGATTGKAAVITYEMLPANTNQAVCFLRLNDTRYAQLLAAWLNTKFIQEVIWNAAVQSAQPNLAMDDIRNFVFLVPPPTEINSICDYLAGVTRQLDKQQRKIQSAIDKLKQYRTALITNAVTGKIDVREAGSWGTEAPASS